MPKILVDLDQLRLFIKKTNLGAPDFSGYTRRGEYFLCFDRSTLEDISYIRGCVVNSVKQDIGVNLEEG